MSCLHLHLVTYLQQDNAQPNQYRQRLTKQTNPQPSQHTQDRAHTDLPNCSRVCGAGFGDDGRPGFRGVVAHQVVFDPADWIWAIASDRLRVAVLKEEGCGEDERGTEHQAAAEAREEEGHFETGRVESCF
jgi:hypothetical protein